MPDQVILHLSDLHFGWNDSSPQKCAERKSALNNLITRLSQLEVHWKPTIVVISGDIGWSGKRGDYELAQEWIERLLSSL